MPSFPLRAASALASLALGLCARSSFAAGEIRLLGGDAYLALGWESGTFDFDALVENLGYEKVVDVHMRDPAGGASWIDVPLSYMGPADDGRERWHVSTYLPMTMSATSVELALRYTVNGQTYWDNNGGSNYVIPLAASTVDATSAIDGALLQGPNVLVADVREVAAGRGGYWAGAQIDLVNLGYEKTVTVVYSTDGWATTQTSSATYMWGPGTNGVERWQAPLPCWVDISLAVAYTVDGQTYWDNNFGQNYFFHDVCG